MLSLRDEPLSAWTTLRLGGPARRLLETGSRTELYDVVAGADAEHEPVLVMGRGSNLVVADAGYAGTVVRVASRGVRVKSVTSSAATVTVEAGEDWDPFVERADAEGWLGLEALAGIPGTVGAVPIQNVGAYGQEVADTVTEVHTFDRLEARARTLAAADCGFAYRSSVFKADLGRYVVGAVTFRLRRGSLGTPVHYVELARALGLRPGERAPAHDVRRSVLELRRSKGMVLDDLDRDTWSAGSFFTNPFIEPSQVPAGAPSFPQSDGRIKTSAAWLIDAAGFAKGYGNARVSLSTKHSLALTNRGGATTSDLLALADEVRRRVQTTFGILLEPEPTLVNCSL